MSIDEKFLFRVGERAAYFWSGYGAVCPGLVTTNGDLRLLAQVVVSHRCGEWRDNYQISDSAIDADFDDEDALTSALARAWTEWTAQKATAPSHP